MHILKGLDYLHAHNVIHGDIKGSNVLVDDHGIWKLADFGGSNKIIKHSNQRQRMVGTAQWMAPEVIRSSQCDRFADIWSLGCIVIEMLQGSPPWKGWDNTYATLFKVAKTRQPPPFPPNISYEATDFLQRWLNVDPKRRPNVRTLLGHPFIINEKIDNPQPKEFYGVGEISKNFKSFIDKFVDNDDEEQKTMLSKINDEISEDQDSNQIRMSDIAITRTHTNKSTVIKFYDEILKEEEKELNPFASSSQSESFQDVTAVKILKGGRLRENQKNRFSINAKPVIKDQGNKVLLQFHNSIQDNNDFISRSKTEKLQVNRDFKIDKLVDLQEQKEEFKSPKVKNNEILVFQDRI